MGGRNAIRPLPPCGGVSEAKVRLMSTFHEFQMASITGDDVSFDRFEGRFCLIVNVASN